MKIHGNEIKAVIFDMDGVLIDTEKYLTKYWCMAAKEWGFPMKFEHACMIRSLQGKYAEVKLKSIFGQSFDYEKIRSRRKELMNEHISLYGIEPKPNVKESLAKIKGAGYFLAVATSTDSERTEKYLKDIEIYDLYDEIICSNMVENGKPEPDIYIYACDRIGIKPENCIAVEDSPNGILSAYRANMNVIMIPDLTEAGSDDIKMAYKIANSLSELVEILEIVEN